MSEIDELYDADTETDEKVVKVNLTEQRVGKVMDLVSRMWPRHKIVKWCKEEWDVSFRTGDDYIRRARESLAETLLPDREKLLQDSLSYWQDYIVRCQEANDRQNEMLARRHMEKIMGLDGESDGSSNQPVTINLIEKEVVKG